MKVKLTIPGLKTKAWAVKGKTLEEAFECLQAHKWWGRYRSHQSYAASFDKEKKIYTVTLKAKPEIIMPKWSGYAKATKAEQAEWDKMCKALERHEKNHHDIFLKAAEAWRAELEKGDALDAAGMKKAWSSFNTDTQAKQDSYDSSSSHGQKEGVALTIPAGP